MRVRSKGHFSEGAARATYGHPRMTLDLDVVTETTAQDVGRWTNPVTVNEEMGSFGGPVRGGAFVTGR